MISTEDLTALEALADQIPHMGGRLMGPFLRQLAREAPGDSAIVELGAWLGAGTAQFAIGIRERARQDLQLHVYDNFATSRSSAEKANRQGYTDLREGDDTLARVTETLRPFGVPVNFTQGMLGPDTRWSGMPISVYSDDASKYAHTFFACLKVFAPSWIVGTTVLVLMDYNLFRMKTDLPPNRLESMRAQYDFMTSHPDKFEEMATGMPYRTAAAFRYVAPLAPEDIPDVPNPKSRRGGGQPA